MKDYDDVNDDFCCFVNVTYSSKCFNCYQNSSFSKYPDQLLIIASNCLVNLLGSNLQWNTQGRLAYPLIFRRIHDYPEANWYLSYPNLVGWLKDGFFARNSLIPKL